MSSYKAGYVGRGKVVHLTTDRITLCFDSFNGKSRRIEFAVAVAETAQEALAKAVESGNGNICQVCAKVGA